MLANVRFILVSPAGAINIGSICRIMANMGLADLIVVAPRCDVQDEAARNFAMHGDAVLRGLRVVPDLATALDGCVKSYATSSKLGLYRRNDPQMPDAAAEEALSYAERGPVAFAFGREDTGLLTRELLAFDRIVSIPAHASYPVLNVAAAATVQAYELYRAAQRRAGRPELPMALQPDLADDTRKQIMFAKLFDALERVGFLFGRNPDHLKYALRHMLGRLDLTVNEADILLGLARQIRWYVDHHPRRDDLPQRWRGVDKSDLPPE